VALFELFLEQKDPRIRLEGLTELHEHDRRPGSPERHLIRGLGDPEPRVAAAAVRMLFSLGRPEAIDVLGGYLEGVLEGVDPTPALSRRVAQGLLALGQRGRERLCRAVEALRTSVRPRLVRVGQAICEELRPHRQEPAVARVLGRWRLSPAGLVSFAAFRRQRKESGEAS
jgi:hypothetical protein